MKNLLKRFMSEEDGATMIEYGLLAALISVVAILAITQAGEQVNLKFEAVRDALSGAAGGAAP